MQKHKIPINSVQMLEYNNTTDIFQAIGDYMLQVTKGIAYLNVITQHKKRFYCWKYFETRKNKVTVAQADTRSANGYTASAVSYTMTSIIRTTLGHI